MLRGFLSSFTRDGSRVVVRFSLGIGSLWTSEDGGGGECAEDEDEDDG